MKITELRINGIHNPVGFDFWHIACSWKVSDSPSRHPTKTVIEVSEEASFENVICQKKGRYLCAAGEKLELDLKPRTVYYWRVSVTGDAGDTAVSETAHFETGKMWEAWEAKWIGLAEEDQYHPILSFRFSAGKKLLPEGKGCGPVCGALKKARLYICGVGLYEAYLNGKRVGEEYLTPYINDYISGLQYQVYDVAEQISEKNTICILLGNGWYKGRFGNGREHFGDRFAAIAELFLEYDDGTNEKIVTDTDWHYRGSDIEESDIYDGEVFNRMLWHGKENPEKEAVAVPVKYPLLDRYSLPVRTKEIREVQEVLHTPAGETVLDFGQNMTGYVSFHVPPGLLAGSRIELDFGEVLQNGNFYRDNYRTAKSRFTYISDGREEEAAPHFTFFGFRYVRVTGWKGEARPSDFCGSVVYSDLEQTGWIETSNPKVNRLFWNSVWGQKGNFLDIPTDCPQRDERLGWTGDICVFAPTAGYHMDTRAFLSKFLRDLRADQLRRGGITANTIPDVLGMGGAGSVWGDAASLIPYTQYWQFGDLCELEECYPLMKDWVDSITRRDQERGEKYRFDFGFHFGDWLSMDGATPRSQKGGTEDGYIGTVYYYASACAVAEAAQALGKVKDQAHYEELAGKIREAFIREYITPEGRLAMQTQTGYLLALKYGLYTDREKLIQGLNMRFQTDGFQIKGGFVGATAMCSVLAENGLEDLAWQFLLNESCPGWLYCVDMGATTIWERWNSLLPDGRISGTGMNSLNHYSYGSVCEFLYRYAAGIAPAAPGFRRISITPRLTGRLTFVNGTYHSVRGTIVSNWRILEDGNVKLHVEIPFDTTAVLTLPYSERGQQELEAGSYDYLYRPTRDLLHRYSMETRLGELAKDPRAVRILEKRLPQAARLIEDHNPENLSLTMRSLSDWIYLGCGREETEEAMREIGKLNTLGI